MKLPLLRQWECFHQELSADPGNDYDDFKKMILAETEFCYISEKRYLNTIVFLTVLFFIIFSCLFCHIQNFSVFHISCYSHFHYSVCRFGESSQ